MTRQLSVVITGAAGAIGRELVKRYSSDGYAVHAVDMSDSVVELASLPGVSPHQADITQSTELEFLAELKHIDVLINGVGAWPLLSIDEVDPGLWTSLLDINLNSAYFITQATLSGLRNAQGSITNISSAIALKGHEHMIHYATAKAGIIGMTRSLARALGEDGIRVNAVAPGLVATPQALATWSEEQVEQFRSSRSLHLDITVDDVVESVMFLASDKARVITGQTLVVDGGTVLH